MTEREVESREKDAFHTLKVAVENDWVHARFSCTAPEGADCRLICTDSDCEMWEVDGSHVHPLKDSGECNAKVSFEAMDWLECHEAYGYESVLYDGPVNAFWDGEDFQWRILGVPDQARATCRAGALAEVVARLEIELSDIGKSSAPWRQRDRFGIERAIATVREMGQS